MFMYRPFGEQCKAFQLEGRENQVIEMDRKYRIVLIHAAAWLGITDKGQVKEQWKFPSPCSMHEKTTPPAAFP